MARGRIIFFFFFIFVSHTDTEQCLSKVCAGSGIKTCIRQGAAFKELSAQGDRQKLKKPCSGTLLVLQHADGLPHGGVTYTDGHDLGTWEGAALPSPPAHCLLNTPCFLLSAVFWSLRESDPGLQTLDSVLPLTKQRSCLLLPAGAPSPPRTSEQKEPHAYQVGSMLWIAEETEVWLERGWCGPCRNEVRPSQDPALSPLRLGLPHPSHNNLSTTYSFFLLQLGRVERWKE